MAECLPSGPREKAETSISEVVPRNE